MTTSVPIELIGLSNSNAHQSEPHGKELPRRKLTVTSLDQRQALCIFGMHTEAGTFSTPIVGDQAAQQLAEADPAGWDVEWGA